MWLLIFIFIIITVLIAWTLFGYFIYIFFAGLYNRRKSLEFPDSWPKMSVIIPCYNEEDGISAKIKNTAELNYPRKLLEIIFVDGGSTDNTVKSLEAEIGKNDLFKIVTCPQKGKINQLNHVLPKVQGEIVLNTDVDAILDKDALKWIAAEFAADSNVLVVGAYCSPSKALEIEHYYWMGQNKGRLLETDAKTSSIVIAQCYAFRKGLLKSFPEDVVADDVYIAFFANMMGGKTVYSRHATAIETRNPQSYMDFISHKFRKSNAFLRESLRFVYRLSEMDNFFKVILLTRISQQLFLPWALLFWILIAGVLLTLFRYDVVIFGMSFLLILLVVTNRFFAWTELPDERHRYSFPTIVKGYILTTIILLATGLSYPFFRQESTYARLDDTAAKTKNKP